MLGRLHGAMARGSATDPDALLAAWELADLLVLDDVGQGRPGQWDASQVFRLVDARWRSMRPDDLHEQPDAARVGPAPGAGVREHGAGRGLEGGGQLRPAGLRRNRQEDQAMSGCEVPRCGQCARWWHMGEDPGTWTRWASAATRWSRTWASSARRSWPWPGRGRTRWATATARARASRRDGADGQGAVGAGASGRHDSDAAGHLRSAAKRKERGVR